MKDTFLGIPIYRFYYPGDRDAVHEECKRLTYRHNGGNRIWDRVFLDGEGGSDLHTFPQFEDLFTWIDECLAEVARDIGMPNQLKINSSWANLNRKGDYFYDHTHANCFASSNYYVNGGPETVTEWYLPNPWYSKSNIWPWGEWTEEKFFLKHEELRVGSLLSSLLLLGTVPHLIYPRRIVSLSPLMPSQTGSSMQLGYHTLMCKSYERN